ncbi:MAG: hypothetical protein ACKO0Z_08600 [Betaproteobacteria bacterium]
MSKQRVTHFGRIYAPREKLVAWYRQFENTRHRVFFSWNRSFHDCAYSVGVITGPAVRNPHVFSEDEFIRAVKAHINSAAESAHAATAWR